MHAHDLLRKGKKKVEILAYIYEADVHCPDCTKGRFPTVTIEECTDREGNIVNPVFSSDSDFLIDHAFCGDCQCQL